jgi:microcin C transport system substrate-binding protein
MHGDLKYKPGEVFDYVNPDAPTGGNLRLGAVGTFDSLNPFITKGKTPAGLDFINPLVYERLMTRANDEPFSLYGLIAETVDVADDRSFIIFNLRPEAKWADGKPITTDDVIFTHTLLRDKGRPNLRLFYSKVAKVEKLGPRSVKFTFKPLENGNEYDPELPLLLGLMSILPKHKLQGKDFESLATEEIMGSGPYKIKNVDFGRSIVYERRNDYWGKDMPLNKGHYLFDTVRYDYYRDNKVAMEAFKAGEYDIRSPGEPGEWHTQYSFDATHDGRVKKIEIDRTLPVLVYAMVFNTRRPQFKDRRVREAMGYAFDFEWLNKNLFYNAYTRTRSFFDNTELAARGLPEGKELELLKPFENVLPQEVFTNEYAPSKTDGSGNIRLQLRHAKKLLNQAGYRIESGTLKNAAGESFQFEIMTVLPEQEKIALAFARNLKHLGIEATIRQVDSAQFEARRNDFDFDMMINSNWGGTLSPGREQEYYWSTNAANENGSRNYPGVQSPVVDHLCNELVLAKDRETLIATARALDRVLTWGHYVIPLYHMRKGYLAFWDKFGYPDFRPEIPTTVSTWWNKNTA